MYIKPRKYHPNDPGESIDSHETIYRSPSAFIGGQFQYTYGAQGAAHNSAGRLVSRRDESGSISYRYGLMGEVTYEQRSLERLTPLEPERSVVMRYRSDYLGRMASITYPDGEKITHTYDPGGQVTGIRAARGDGTATILVKKIGYDEYGQRTYLEYGNGNITTYTYDEQRRWMDTLKTRNTHSGTTLQNLTYRFDAVGNVLSRGEVTSRYSTSQSYTYDALYQLTGAQGNYTERPAGIDDWRQEYSQNFSYDALGNLTRKISTQTRLPQSSGALNLNYQLNYEYDENKPRRATKIGEMYYGYDPNGNLTEESVIPVGHSRAGQAANITQIGKVKMADQGFGLVNNPEDDASLYRLMFTWDEENRLKKVQDPSNTVRFLYDADGMRTVKHSREGETLYYNTWWSETEDLPGFRRSKHIYLGSERIVSRLSIEGVGPNYEDLNTYYYHPDHLGSVHSVSDSEGNPYERIEYTPYGEMWIEIREDANTKDLNYIPYRFTSKEWDSETGLYSFPARYFEPKFSRWMSADPAGFGLMNPMDGRGRPRSGYSIVEATNWYSYGANNPVKYVDPTGMRIKIFGHLVTVREILTTIRHPFAAIKVFKNMEKTFAITRQFVYDKQIPGSNHNGKADAFRHALWSAINARDVGEKKAKRFGDAHEAVEGQPDVELEMDLYNNEVGRRVGAANPDATDEELAAIILDLQKRGKLRDFADPSDFPESSFRYGDVKKFEQPQGIGNLYGSRYRYGDYQTTPGIQGKSDGHFERLFIWDSE